MRQLRPLMNSCAWRGFFANREPGGSAAPRLYLPVSRPLASGKYGNIPNPSALAAGMSSRSTSRTSRLYSSWQDEHGKPVLPRRGLRLDDLLRPKIRAAQEAHLALPHQIIERAQRFLDRGLRVRAMQLVKVDPIGAQPLQTRLDRVHDVAPRRPLEPTGVIHRQAELAREHDCFAL